MCAEQRCRVIPGGKAADHKCHTESRYQRDCDSIALEKHCERSWPDIGLICVAAQPGERAGNVDVELMGRRELAIGQARAAAVTEIGEIVQIAIRKCAAPRPAMRPNTLPMVMPMPAA
jgi:hypothetical protein